MSRPRLTWLLGIGILVLLAVIAWFAVLSPRMSQAATLAAQVEQLQTANLTLHNQYNQAVTQARQAPQAAADAQRLFASMPQEAELPLVLDQITQAAGAAGIDANAVTTLTTTVPQALAGLAGTAAVQAPAGVNLATMDIGVSAEGRPGQLLDFVDNLQGLDRAFLIDGTATADVPDAGGRPADQMGTTVTGKMFVLKSALPDLVAQVNELLAQADLAGAG